MKRSIVFAQLTLSIFSCRFGSPTVNEVFFWIGLNQTTPSTDASTTYWMDGNPATFQNFYTGYPDGKYNCFTCTNNHIWFDLNCAEELNFICKMPMGR